MLKFLTGAAAIALAASALSADPGGGKGGGGGGGGNGGGGGKSHEAQGGGGGDGGGKSQTGKGGGGGAEMRAIQAGDGGKGKSADRDARGNGKSAEVDFGSAKPAKAEQRGRDDRGPDGKERGKGFNAPRELVGERGLRDRDSNWRWADSVPQRTRLMIAGCPPGLAKKNNGCLPPGQARKAAAARAFYDNPSWWDFDDRWHDADSWNDRDYRYYDGYLVRSGAGGIESWLPLLGGGLSPGNLWPSQYQSSQLPPYYQDYYGLGSSDGYRYYDDTLYRVDPQSQAITAISALLTGDSFQVGQRVPQGYDVYNVPSSYRDRYVDGPDSNYRYSDGTVYQVDPTTQLVQAAIELLT